MMKEHRTRALTIATLVTACLVGCSKSPAGRQAALIRRQAKNESALIENKADQEANRLDRQSEALRTQAEQAGGLGGQRLKVRAEAAAKEARLVRRQADMQADAVEEAADAKVKAVKSR